MPLRDACTRLLLVLVLLLPTCAAAGCLRAPAPDGHLQEIITPYRFHFLQWEVHNLPPTGRAVDKNADLEAEAGRVRQYFELTDAIRTVQRAIQQLDAENDPAKAPELYRHLDQLLQARNAMRGPVETIISRQVREIYRLAGIRNPLDTASTIRADFPPVYFTLTVLPHLLVVSPRERIEFLRSDVLVADLSLQTQAQIETGVDALGVSSFVSDLAGFAGLYPALIAQDESLSYVIETAAHEWLHQYLAFTPLGFLYLLDVTGIVPNRQIATMNETLATIVSEEIAQRVLERYYPDVLPAEPSEPPERQAFDLNGFMHETRVRTDQLLADGKIQEAEEYMEARRQALLREGYYIRKLNQAYFALNGTYATSPGSVDPIGEQLKQLRSQSLSLADFLHRTMRMTSPQDLRDALNVYIASPLPDRATVAPPPSR